MVAVLAAARGSRSWGLVWDEATQGDFSNLGSAPTALTVGAGHNQIHGATGRPDGPIDLDYLTFAVPDGFVWSALVELPGTQSGGSLSFIGVQSGTQVTVSPAAQDASELLGWTHYSPGAVNADLLPFMGTGGFGSAGFAPPLPAGSYALWLQDFNAGTFAYGFDIAISPADEPEPPSLALFELATCAVFLNRWGQSRRSMSR